MSDKIEKAIKERKAAFKKKEEEKHLNKKKYLEALKYGICPDCGKDLIVFKNSEVKSIPEIKFFGFRLRREHTKIISRTSISCEDKHILKYPGRDTNITDLDPNDYDSIKLHLDSEVPEIYNAAKKIYNSMDYYDDF